MLSFVGFRCYLCGREFGSRFAGYVCAGCGGNLRVEYDYKKLRRRLTRKALDRCGERSIWRYGPLLPVSGRHLPVVGVGWTPLHRARRLGAALGLRNVWIKDDTRNPSASFKDRAGAVAASRARDLGREVITGASTGNAASSLACLAAGMGLRTVLFVPESAPAAKVVQLLVFGARVLMVRGTYDEAFDLCLKATEEYGWYNRNTGYNAFTREGKKTCAFEILEQMGWRCPDVVFVPVGDGNIISGVWKGFVEARRMGWIDRLPRMAAVQASGSDAVKRAFESGKRILPVSGCTVADSISVSVPRDGFAAVQALRESKGFAVSVTDKEILRAVPALARAESVFAEPAGAAAVAGLEKAAARKLVRPQEKVVLLATGNGLKDIASARRSVGKPHRVAPDIQALRRVVKRIREV